MKSSRSPGAAAGTGERASGGAKLHIAMRLLNSSEREVTRKFGVVAPTLLSRVGECPPISFSLVRAEAPMEERSKLSRSEDAYVIHLFFKEVVTDTQLWINGHEHRIPPLRQGGLLMANLRTEPSIWCHSAVEFFRLYVAKETLDTLRLEACGKRSVGLRRPEFGTVDPILFHLAAATVPMLQRQSPGDQLLVDQIALALHHRLSQAYGGSPVEERAGVAGRLLAWQERRINELVEASVGQPVSLQDLANACGLSVNRFSRAFKRTLGCTPHQWLMNRRVAAAKAGLLRSDLPLTELFAAFGFSDASHFSRVFTNATGETPADWRRRRSASSRRRTLAKAAEPVLPDTTVLLQLRAQVAERIGTGKIELSTLTQDQASNDPILRRLEEAVKAAAGADPVLIKELTFALALHVTQRFGCIDTPPPSVRGGLSSWQLRLACHRLDQHVEGDLSLDELAADCGLSPSHFARAFSASTGVPPYRWLLQRRIERAKGLILGGEIPLAEVAVACGFADQSHFTRAFSTLVGQPPKRWKKSAICAGSIPRVD